MWLQVVENKGNKVVDRPGAGAYYSVMMSEATTRMEQIAAAYDSAALDAARNGRFAEVASNTEAAVEVRRQIAAIVAMAK